VIGLLLAASGAWDGTLAAATRRFTRYDGWATVLDLRATWLAGDVRAACDAHRAAIVGLPSPCVEGEDAAVVIAAASDRRRDLTVGVDAASAVVLALRVGGRTCEGGTVTRIERPSPLDRATWTQLTSWDGLWVARFPGCGPGSGPELSIRGPLGGGSLAW
jgi:hypothetical protein